MNSMALAQRVNEIRGRYAGWCPQDKGEHVFETVTAHCPRVSVELGVYGGQFLALIASAMQEVTDDISEYAIHGIDPWSTDALLSRGGVYSGDCEYWSTLDLESVYRQTLQAMREFSNVHLHRMDSVSGLVKFPFPTIDLLHIDGNHSEWHSTQDVLNWVPRVRQGGWIYLDDSDWPSLQTARRFLLEDADLCAEGKTWLAARKK